MLLWLVNLDFGGGDGSSTPSTSRRRHSNFALYLRLKK